MDELDVEPIARAWLTEMESCVRAVDYVRARAIFSPDVVGFGSRGAMLVGLDALEQIQWRHVWGVIRNFTFRTEELHCGADGVGVVWLACPWTSKAVGRDGISTDRPGRITAVLIRANGRWVAVHTHHSLVAVTSVV